MNLILPWMMMFSILTPAKMWFAPDQPLTINVKPDKGNNDLTLVLTDFAGKVLPPKGSADVSGDKSINLDEIFPQVKNVGTYVLWALPKGKDAANFAKDFVGTPDVIGVRGMTEPGAPAGAVVTKIEALRYAVLSSDAGDMTMVFYYDVAPHTADNFLRLSEQGYYNGLTFHRIVPGFVIQGGDPHGDGMGGPGYHINAEFNGRPHVEGVLSMARTQDPDSAGSQFFICLDYAQTKQLDNQYTAFGKVVDGIDAVKKIASAKLKDAQNGTPAEKQVIKNIVVRSVTPGHNPYLKIIAPEK